MLTDLQRAKISALFDIYDANHDGVLEASDFARVATNLANEIGAGDDAQERATLQAQYRVAWDLISGLAERTGDNQLQLTEWTTAFDRVLGSEQHFEAIVLMMSNLVFDTFDLDRNELVDEAEYERFVRAYQTPNASPSVAFRRLDRDGDGRMTRDDAITGIREYFTSNDPEAPGNALFGQTSRSPADDPDAPTSWLIIPCVSLPDVARREAELRAWLAATVAARLRCSPDAIGLDEPFHRYGIDSLERVNIAYELEVWLGYPIDEETLAEVPTINELARRIAADERERTDPQPA
jgi:juvenile hormone diol kinase